MLILTVFKFISDIFIAVLEFVRKHIVPVLCIAFCVVLIWISYSWGYNSADSKWIKFNNDSVSKTNLKIASLESIATGLAAQLQTLHEADVKRLQDMAAKVPPILAHDASGNLLKCNKAPITVYLGPEFKSAWNNLNAESDK